MQGAIALGDSIKDKSGLYRKTAHVPAMVLMHTESSLTPGQKCHLKAVGWDLKVVESIESFTTKDAALAIPSLGLESSFTKLHLWNLTQFDSVIYLSPATLVIGNLVDVFDIVVPYGGQPPLSDFAAVSEVDSTGFQTSFDSAFYLLRPSFKRFTEMMALESVSGDFSNARGEHGFLNKFYGRTRLMLPFTFSLSNLMEFDKEKHHYKAYKELFPLAKTLNFGACRPWDDSCAHESDMAVEVWKEASAKASVQVKRICI